MLAILSAMPQEIDALKALIENPKPKSVGGRTFVEGMLWRTPVVMAFSRWGKVAASMTTTLAIASCGATRVLMTGIAGSLRDDLQVGDLVIARNLYNHDLDASPFFPPTHVPLLNISAIPTDETMSRELLAASTVFLAENGGELMEEHASLLSDSPRRAVRGDIATGDQVIASKEAKSKVRRMVPTAVCVEMEGAGAAQVCHEMGVPFGAIRLISDLADEAIRPESVMAVAGLAGKVSAGLLKRWMVG